MRNKKKKTVYVVVNGRTPGVYATWSGSGGAEEQVKGFSKPLYKGFHTREEAIAWLRGKEAEAFLDKYFPEAAKMSASMDDLDFAQEMAEAMDASNASSVIVNALLKTDTVVLFTDGGAIKNPGPGGYGVVLRYKSHKKELSGGFRRTTNNRMELMACITGLKALNRASDVVLFSDSRYVVNGMSRGWVEKWQSNGWTTAKRQPVSNADLWQELFDLCQIHTVDFRWVKGHAGNPDNERCDRLAVAAAKSNHASVDHGYEQEESVSS